MQQDPSSWNKQLLYNAQSAAATTATTTAATARATAATAVVVAVAATTAATAPGAATGPSALPPPTIHSRSSAATPCLTSSHVRHNTNRNSDVLAIHPSLDLTNPSPSESPLSVPAVHLDSINAIAGYQSGHEPSASHSKSIATPDVLPAHEWLQYNSKPSRDLQKGRVQEVENTADSDDGDNAEDTDMGRGGSAASPHNNDTTLAPSRSTNRRGSALYPLGLLASSAPTFQSVVTGVDQRSSKATHDSIGGERMQHYHPARGILSKVQVRLSDKDTPQYAKDTYPASRMSPSSTSPSSPGTASATDTPSSSSSLASSIASSLSSPTSSDSSPSKRPLSLPFLPARPGTFHIDDTAQPSDEYDDCPSSPETTTAAAPFYPDHGGQTSVQHQSRREAIFLPHFLSGVRPTSVQGTAYTDQQNQGHQDDRSQSNTNHRSSSTARSHIVVTDVRSISFRDISTVPTLTTFGHKRSKRRNSSLSYSCSPASSALSSNSEVSSALSIQQPSASRRKRVKKSSHSTKAPLNLCTPSCGCSKTHIPTAESQRGVERKREHRVSNKNTGSQLMESTGRIRTISESEVSVTDHSQSPHRLLHQRQQHRSRQSSSHQQGQKAQGQEQESEQVHGAMQDSVANPQLHMQHRHHHHLLQHQHLQQSSTTSQHPLQDTQHGCAESVQEHHISNHQHQHQLQLRIQLQQERDQHHKRQRSPPAQKTTFELSILSPTSSAVSSMERLKRARRCSTAAQEDVTSANDDHAEYTDGNQELSWQDRKEQPVRPSGQGAMSLHPLRHADTPQPHNAVQTARIHPFDSEPIALSARTGIVARKVSSIPNTPHPSCVKPSIHPLDTDESLEAAAVESQKHGTKSMETSGIIASSTTTSDEVSKHAVGPSPHSVSVNMHGNEAMAPMQTPQKSKVQDSVQIKKDVATGAASSRSITSAPLSKPAPVPSLVSNSATLALPITRETLRELDMPEIFNNPQLRHDIVFDPHLQFRPNFDGDRGIAKRREADRFWREVGLELNSRRSLLEARREATTTMLNLAGLSSSSPTSRLIQQQAQQMYPLPDAVLLPRLVDELREILLSLLPPPSTVPTQDGGIPPVAPERALLSSTLDPDLLIQELDHGVLDVHTLFRFLGDSLKGHCAPMRDAFVESMVTIVVDSNEIVRGIRMCFEILEWMKLDIANHQLRTLRPWLLNNSIEFEQKYFTRLLTRAGTLNRTIEWFKHSWIQWESVKRSVIGQQSPASELSGVVSRRSSVALATTVHESEQGGNEYRMSSSATVSFTAKRRPSFVRPDIGENILDGVVNEGLLEMILRPRESVNTMPETFELDFYRLRSFHNDFQDLTILCVLLILFRQLAHSCWTQQDLVEIKKVVWLLLTDENADFGANTNPGPGADAAAASASASGKDGPDTGSSSGMKDIVIQIEFAARKVRDRSKNGAASASSTASASLAATSGGPGRLVSGGIGSKDATSASSSSASSTSASGLCASNTNLLTAWLDNALCKTSTLYMLIQKRLLIHFRRWLYLHSCSSMMVLSASCASLASAMSMSSSNPGGDLGRTDEDEEDESFGTSTGRAQPGVTVKGDLKETPDRELANGNDKERNAATASESVVGGAVQGQASENGAAPNTAASTMPAPASAPQLSPEEANKAAAEALAAKLSFNAAEMEAHGLTGLEDEMVALLEKIRAVSEFNKKVYGSWYCDLVKQGRTENWLEKPSSSSAE